MRVLIFSTTNSQVTDNYISVVNSNPVNLIHDIWYNKTGKFVVVRTAPAGGGTLLTETTDYTVGDIFPDADLPTSISPDDGYTTISIVNATYHNTDLYVSYYPIADIVNAEKWNNDIGYNYVTATDDYVFRKTKNQVFTNFYVTVTRQATAKSVILLDDAINDGQLIVVDVVGAGVGNVNLDVANSATIDGETASVWEWDGIGKLELVYDHANTNYRVISTGIWDSADIADSGADIDRKLIKYTTGKMLITGAIEFDMTGSSITNRNIGSYGWSYYVRGGLFLFGLTANSYIGAKVLFVETTSIGPISTRLDSGSTTGARLVVFDSSNTDTYDIGYEANLTWR